MSMQKTNIFRTSLHKAQTLEVAKALVEHGADIEAVDYNKLTPMIYHFAPMGNDDIVKYLISIGAHVFFLLQCKTRKRFHISPP